MNKTQKVTFPGWFELYQGQKPAASGHHDHPGGTLPLPGSCLPMTLAAGERTGCGSLVPWPGEQVSAGCAPAFLIAALRHTHEGGEQVTEETLLLRVVGM